nr:MAG TPA: FeoB-associated Cys-rich membrane protein [Crassvirales sp.]
MIGFLKRRSRKRWQKRDCRNCYSGSSCWKYYT